MLVRYTHSVRPVSKKLPCGFIHDTYIRYYYTIHLNVQHSLHAA